MAKYTWLHPVGDDWLQSAQLFCIVLSQRSPFIDSKKNYTICFALCHFISVQK